MAVAVSSVTLSSRAWTSPVLDGQLYGEPLTFGGRVFVATENDTVYALSATSGAVRVVDPCRHARAFGLAPLRQHLPHRGDHRHPGDRRDALGSLRRRRRGGRREPRETSSVGLDTATGKAELTQDVDPAGSKPAALLQRTGLTLDAGRVVFGYGGNYGDCGSYHGWVIVGARGRRHPGGRSTSTRPRARARAPSGWAARPPSWTPSRQHLGRPPGTARSLVVPRLRRQRLGARALAVAHPPPVLRPVLVGRQQRQPTSTSPPRPPCSPTARWWPPASRGLSTC